MGFIVERERHNLFTDPADMCIIAIFGDIHLNNYLEKSYDRDGTVKRGEGRGGGGGRARKREGGGEKKREGVRERER